MLVLVKIGFAQQQLDVVELTYPGTLRYGAKLAIMCVARKGGVYLAKVAVGKAVLHHGHVAQGYGHDDVGFVGIKGEPHVAVADDA